MSAVRFRYLITDLFRGAVVGTNNRQVAEDYMTSEDFFVVDTGETGTEVATWLSDGVPVEIEEV